MKYQKAPSDAQINSLLQALRIAMKNKNEFFVMADLNPHALTAGSAKLDLLAFMVKCMSANDEIAELLINVVTNFIANKILNDLCSHCDKADSCEKQKTKCNPENLYSDITSHLEAAIKLTKPGLN